MATGGPMVVGDDVVLDVLFEICVESHTPRKPAVDVGVQRARASSCAAEGPAEKVGVGWKMGRKGKSTRRTCLRHRCSAGARAGRRSVATCVQLPAPRREPKRALGAQARCVRVAGGAACDAAQSA